MSALARLPLAIAAVAVSAVAAAAVLGWLPGSAAPAGAQALGLGAPPACQCSAPVPVANLSIQVVHCLCGGTSCVISQHAGGAHQMQCVK
ncbi:hypothetical protein MOJ79_00620 [Calidifontimicrobium sp. SYSU G02091]|uniref:hypothetical protein n=1 Tax=Calidifontimicrobium sp. SYSU G02091 TaxID=2926421 RepID=UPI001F5350DE|nr:hypothetical protein [Calidifontimicrobium sp. SYSU G02091]MCI1190342.1 hypothetical protein [Calidifontimicrobium sp. SYSU G02091]